MESLPPEIANLVNLERLFLRDNPYLKTLPSEIGRLKKLIWLDLANCGLKVLPPEIGSFQFLKIYYQIRKFERTDYFELEWK